VDRAICQRCGHSQPEGWTQSDLCVACGASFRLQRVESLVTRIAAAAGLVHDALGGILLATFLGLLAMLLAAYVGVGFLAAIGAGAAGLMIGGAVARRVFFGGATRAPAARAEPVQWRHPEVEAGFQRLLARQRVLGLLLISACVALAVLHFIDERDWPIRVTPAHLVAGILIAVIIVLPLGLLNWRCPNCRRNLGASMSLRQCPRCGVILRN
jgi:hypothetical protein